MHVVIIVGSRDDYIGGVKTFVKGYRTWGTFNKGTPTIKSEEEEGRSVNYSSDVWPPASFIALETETTRMGGGLLAPWDTLS